MTNNFLKLCLLFLVASILSMKAHAQDCRVTPELIFTFNETRAGAFSIWDNVYGMQDKDERFIGVVPGDEETFALGERFEKKGSQLKELFFVKFDKRGRVAFESTFQQEHLKAITHFQEHGEGFLVLGRYKAPGQFHKPWIALLDKKGQITESVTLNDDEGDLYAYDIVQKPDAKGYYLATSLNPASKMTGKTGSEAEISVLYKLDERFKKQKKSAYLPGVESRIFKLESLSDGDLAVVGYVTNQAGREVGWVLRLGSEGQIKWQREYARGSRAHITHVERFLGDGLILGGLAEPLPGLGSNDAGWLALVDINRGDVQWQRYYQGDLHHQIKGISVHNDNTISVLMNAKPSDQNGQKFSRLLRLNRRGFLLDMDAYFYGEGAHAEQLILGEKQQRFLAGSSNMRYIIEGQSDVDDITLRSMDSWVTVGAIHQPYIDPCN